MLNLIQLITHTRIQYNLDASLNLFNDSLLRGVHIIQLGCEICSSFCAVKRFGSSIENELLFLFPSFYNGYIWEFVGELLCFVIFLKCTLIRHSEAVYLNALYVRHKGEEHSQPLLLLKVNSKRNYVFNFTFLLGFHLRLFCISLNSHDIKKTHLD